MRAGSCTVKSVLVQCVNGEARAQFGLEPGGLGRHDAAAVGNGHQLVHRDRIQGERDGHFAAVHPALELSEAADAAYEVDPLVRTAYVPYSSSGEITVPETSEVSLSQTGDDAE